MEPLTGGVQTALSHTFTLPRAGSVFVDVRRRQVTVACKVTAPSSLCQGCAALYVDGMPLRASRPEAGTSARDFAWSFVSHGMDGGDGDNTVSRESYEATGQTGLSQPLEAGAHILSIRRDGADRLGHRTGAGRLLGLGT